MFTKFCAVKAPVLTGLQSDFLSTAWVSLHELQLHFCNSAKQMHPNQLPQHPKVFSKEELPHFTNLKAKHREVKQSVQENKQRGAKDIRTGSVDCQSLAQHFFSATEKLIWKMHKSKPYLTRIHISLWNVNWGVNTRDCAFLFIVFSKLLKHLPSSFVTGCCKLSRAELH